MDLAWLDSLPPEAQAALLTEVQQAQRERKLEGYRPYAKQREFHRLGATMRERLLRAGNQNGKALRVDMPVLTPNGWVRIDSLQVGDTVIGGDGIPCNVIGVYPQGVKPLWEAVFDDGSSVVCCDEHLWKVAYPEKPGEWAVERMADIIPRLGRQDRRPRVPAVNVQMPPVAGNLPMDPYALGVMLGDGCFRGTSPMLATEDAEIAASVDAVRVKGCDYRVRGVIGNIKALGLWGTHSHEKYIPDEYMIAPPNDRLAILQGLMDTDGFASKAGAAWFYTTSPMLADGVAQLCRSLGGKASINSRQTRYNGKDGKPSYAVNVRVPMCPFRLGRKAARWRRVSKTLNRVMREARRIEDGEALCIAVDSPDHTYVTKDYLVTHNTYCVAAEAAYHLTGLYPDDWVGRRWDRPVVVWASSETGESTRDNPQRALLGLPGEEGTGMAPKIHLGLRPGLYGMASGTADLYDFIRVRHHTRGRFDGWSMLRFKYYAQGRRKWQGPPVDFVWFDEEPPEDIYDEGLARTIATGGMVALSFTPLLGMSEVVRRYLVDPTPERSDTNMTIEDAEHIPAEERARIIASFPPHEREARAKGIPTLGSGRIFPVDEAQIAEPPIEIPDHWPRLAGMDFGWDHPTAAVWAAWDRDTDTVHIYDAYRVREQPVVVHAAAIKARGSWIPVAWPHDGLQHDKGAGIELAEQYRSQGVAMLGEMAQFPDTPEHTATSRVSVEAGIADMLDRMLTGRLKVAAHLKDWFDEFRLYHRKDGKIVKEYDDLLSATRYLIMMLRFAETKPAPERAAAVRRFNWRVGG